MTKILTEDEYVDSVYNEIKSLILNARRRVVSYINTEHLDLYWNIGCIIMKVQQGEVRAKYGAKVLDKISAKLTYEFGSGYSVRNLRLMRNFYNCYQIRQAMPAELSWSHHIELLVIKNKEERDFYIQECINSRWDYRTLRRQIKSKL